MLAGVWSDGWDGWIRMAALGMWESAVLAWWMNEDLAEQGRS